MIQFFKENIEPKKRLRMIEIVFSVLLGIASIVSIGYGMFEINSSIDQTQFIQSLEMTRDKELEDCGEDNTVCEVTYKNGEQEIVLSYPYEEYLELNANTITAYEYETENGTKLYFEHQDITASRNTVFLSSSKSE